MAKRKRWNIDAKRLNSKDVEPAQRVALLAGPLAFFFDDPPEPGELLLPEVKDGRLRLYLYDPIGYFAVDAKDFVAAMNQKDDYEAVDLYINSPGGEVYDASAIRAQLIRKSKDGVEVTAHVDGLAASAATLVALAADKVLAVRGSTFMIHNSWTMAAGNAVELDKVAAELRKVDTDAAGIYAAKMDSDVETVRKYMADETYFTADEAVEAGLVDGLAEAVEPKDAKEPDGESGDKDDGDAKDGDATMEALERQRLVTQSLVLMR